jgi:hypothetical protein
MSTDYRALCAELLKAVDEDVIDTNDGQRFQAVIDRVRAELAHPEPEELTDEAILRTAAKELDYEFDESWFLTGRNFRPLEAEPLELLNFARAVIDADRARYGRPAVAPVAVSERLPRPDDCFFNPGAKIGSCWCFHPADSLGGIEWWSFEPLSWSEDATYWLPHWAIPLPTTTQETDR